VRAALAELAGTVHNGSRRPLNGASAVPGVVPTELGRAHTSRGPQSRGLVASDGPRNRTVSSMGLGRPRFITGSDARPLRHARVIRDHHVAEQPRMARPELR
jgi:hypothetical protein